MGFYERRVLPVLLDKAMANPAFGETRARVLSDLRGTVLEIGFGSGHNLAHYPSAVTAVESIEPSDPSIERAAKRIAASGRKVQRVGTDAQRMELPDASVDTVVSTWTLCSIPDPSAALQEIRRVLKPGGRLRFVEHGMPPDPKVQRVQRRIEPVWKRLTGGCHLSRSIDTLITGSGLEITDLRTFDHPKDPKFASWTFEGTAIKL